MYIQNQNIFSMLFFLQIFLSAFSITRCDIYVDMNSSFLFLNVNGSKEYPFPNLSIALKNSLDLSSMIFDLEPNESSYPFFDYFPYNHNITLSSDSYK